MSTTTLLRFLKGALPGLMLLTVLAAHGRDKTYVVVVGVDNQNTLMGIPQATARRAATYYKTQQHAEVHLLLDQNATLSNVRRVMKSMFARADKDDAIVFIFDGHGYITTSWAAGGVSVHGCAAGGLGYDEIQRIMRQSKAGRKMAFVSACYSGGITYRHSDTRRVTPRSSADVMIYASAPGDKPGLIGSEGADFLRYVLDGMEGAADANGDAKVTARELFNYANPLTIERFGVHPQMWGKFSDTMVVAEVNQETGCQ